MKITSNGSLQKRGEKSWRATVSVGFDSSGKRIRYLKTFSNCNKSEAKKLMQEWIAQHQGGLRPHGEETPFSEYASDWHEARRIRGELKASSLERERYTIKTLNEYLGAVTLGEIDKSMVEKMYIAMRKDKRGASTLNKCHKKLSQILNAAIDDDLILRNPCAKIKAPARPEPKRGSLSLSDAARLASLTESLEMESELVAVRLGLEIGARVSEILGLCWEQVDFEASTITIDRQLTRDGKLDTPKTKKSVRVVSVSPQGIDYLLRWRELQREELREAFIRQSPATPVISTRVGTPINQSNFRRWFVAFCIEHGYGSYKIENGKRKYSGLVFHELRNTQATLLLANGTDVKTVQDRLGHSRASTTLDIYARALPENNERAAILLGDLLSPENSYEKVAKLA